MSKIRKIHHFDPIPLFRDPLFFRPPNYILYRQILYHYIPNLQIGISLYTLILYSLQRYNKGIYIFKKNNLNHTHIRTIKPLLYSRHNTLHLHYKIRGMHEKHPHQTGGYPPKPLIFHIFHIFRIFYLTFPLISIKIKEYHLIILLSFDRSL